MGTPQKQTQKTSSTPSESILVVKRSMLFTKETNAWHGMNTTNIEDFINTINNHKEFLPRPYMETDPTYKQIIPYIVFCHDNKVFLMQRKTTASEQRLQGKLSLGIGGHIRKEDMTSNSLFDWAKREFYEEVHYTGTCRITPLGMVNDDSDDVGKVHLGLVLLLTGDSNNISVKSELKSGILVSLDECMKQYDQLESWSQIVVKHLKTLND